MLGAMKEVLKMHYEVSKLNYNYLSSLSYPQWILSLSFPQDQSPPHLLQRTCGYCAVLPLNVVRCSLAQGHCGVMAKQAVVGATPGAYWPPWSCSRTAADFCPLFSMRTSPCPASISP